MKRGEIWLVGLDPTRGHEQRGRRPVLIVSPEAFNRVLEKTIEGFGELFRMLSYQKVGTSTIQSRAIGGVAGGTYLFALPGSTSAVKDGWDDILVHQLDNRNRPCNLVELMPRLQEHVR